MKKLFVALMLLPLIPLTYGAATAQNAPQGDVAKGKALWEGNTTACRNCHGQNGEGAFGPDLAGRGLSFVQFKKAVHEPWGVMPAFPQMNDQQLADMTSYFASLPKPAATGKWRFEPAENQPRGLQIAINMGCAQCHQPGMNGPRGNMGAVNADYNYFAALVYNHTTEMPKHRQVLGAQGNNNNMGNFMRSRMPESELREVYNWMRDDIGFRPFLQGNIAANGATYTLNVRNGGAEGRGIAAEGVTVRAIIPAGVTVVSATGDGYQGVKTEGNNTYAEWTLARSAPRQAQTYTITLSRAVTPQDNFRGEVRWRTPAPKSGPANDVVAINLPGAG
jgi:uncharacterized repeat protein (TIGR01451 family)